MITKIQRGGWFLLGLFLALGCVYAQTATVTVDVTKPGPAINPRMYGVFLEEINHGVDGGLYGELIRNRAFEDSRAPEGYTLRDGRWVDAHGFDSGFSRYGYTTDGIPFWSLVKEGSAKGAVSLEKTGGVTEQSSYCARLDIEEPADGRLGIANSGFFGIGLKQGAAYTVSLYARGGRGFSGPLAVRLEDASGQACSNEAKLEGIGDTWKQLKGTLTASKTEPKARLVIAAGASGRVWLDFVSLFPKETWRSRPNGLRPDIAQMIADLKPGFVRFPGGCVVEGGTVETAYNWKLTVGPLAERQERWGPWNYRRTQGVGLHEYLQFCEDLGAEPLWVGFAGQTCIFRERENVPMQEMAWVRDNFLDLVEYANGAVTSLWGEKRAEAGHQSTFGLKYVEIGNENEGPEFGQRYRFVYDALKSRYPDLTYLADLSWTSRESLGEAVWDIEDRHYYSSPRWFISRFHDYDGRDRKLPPLYLGEVAVTTDEGGPLRGNLRAALAEGVFLMGCERNADTVRMVSYAPLLGHVEGRTELTNAPPPWHALIYFDGTRAFGTASYYLWRAFAANRPTRSVATEVSFPDAKPAGIQGRVGVGAWDATAEFKDVRVEKEGRMVYASDFESGSSEWAPDGGQWSVEAGAYRQSRRGRGFSYVGDETWSNYTLTLKARKLSGDEGFLIVFARKGNDRSWWNLGGWGNSRHAIEANRIVVGDSVPGTIQTDRWYDIKVEVDDRRVRCYLDGQLLHDVIVPPEQTFFAQAGVEELTGDFIVKAINTAGERVTASLSFPGAKGFRPRAEAMILTSASPTDNNSLDEPFKVAPRFALLEHSGGEVPVAFEPYSLTVIRFGAQITSAGPPGIPAITRIDPPEQGFFAKRLDYRGIPIKASAEVVDEALHAAYDRLDRMMANLLGVPAKLAAAGVELHIIGRNQVTTDLPEWRHDKGKPLKEYNGLTRDQRTRGMGGRLTSCGEENLLRLESDRYRGRDICIHEFAHSILGRGVPREIRERFEAQRLRSLAAGRWVKSYAGSNVHEFFAELAMWYFGTHGDMGMEGKKPADGRQGLKDYDPEAYSLVDDFWSGRPIAETRQD